MPVTDVDYWYHMFGNTIGTLEIQEFDGTSWNTLTSITGNQGNAWLHGTATLLNPGTASQVRFRYVLGGTFNGNCAIDDVTVPGSFNVLPFESNGPEASLDIDGILTTGLAPAVVTTNVEVDPAGAVLSAATGTLTLSATAAAGSFFEIVSTPMPLVSLGAGGADLGGEVVNLDFSQGFSGFNGGSGIALLPLPLSPFPGATGTTITGSFTTTSPLDASLQGVVTDVNAPLGFRLTQGTELHIPVITIFPPYSACPSTIGGDLANLSEDFFVQVNPSSAFTFYGTSYSSLFINMNGNVTFGSGSGDFTSSEAEMLANQPRIAPLWDDWSPQDVNQGTVRTFDDGSVFSVEWFDVHHRACGGGIDSNTFCATLVLATGEVLLEFGHVSLCAALNPSTDQLTGISSGGSLSAPGNVDLSLPGGHLGATATSALYEDFNQAVFGPFDLEGPPQPPALLLLFTPIGGNGIGPYQQT